MKLLWYYHFVVLVVVVCRGCYYYYTIKNCILQDRWDRLVTRVPQVREDVLVPLDRKDLKDQRVHSVHSGRADRQDAMDPLFQDPSHLPVHSGRLDTRDIPVHAAILVQ